MNLPSGQSYLKLLDLDLIDYQSAWTLQKELQAERIQNQIPDTLITCRHPAVITKGRSTKSDSLLASFEDLKKAEIDCYDVERGGEITYHNPAQIVCYPIFDLNNHKRDVAWFMRKLEEVVINVLKRWDIAGIRNPGFTGVWVNDETGQLMKIASLGIRISRWVTMHGIALNVLDDLQGFNYIIPCGINNVKMTCLEALKSPNIGVNNSCNHLELQRIIKAQLVEEFIEVFNYTGLMPLSKTGSIESRNM